MLVGDKEGFGGGARSPVGYYCCRLILGTIAASALESDSGFAPASGEEWRFAGSGGRCVPVFLPQIMLNGCRCRAGVWIRGPGLSALQLLCSVSTQLGWEQRVLGCR